MAVSSITLCFFDASVLYAAAVSATGGSGFLLSVCQRGFLRAASSPSVLVEAERNLAEDQAPELLAQYYLKLAQTPVALVPTPSDSVIQHYTERYFEDDHVIASAIAARAEFLITLDRPLLRRARADTLPMPVLTPGEFIQQVLPTHPEFASIR